jgi:hypothetical protein
MLARAPEEVAEFASPQESLVSDVAGFDHAGGVLPTTKTQNTGFGDW